MSDRTIQDLQMMQAAPLNAKIAMTKRRIRDWVNEFGLDGVYVSFSGGKDSTVLLTIARQEYPKMKAMFLDTGLEFPEIRDFVKTWDNVDWVRPKMNFRQVIAKYGYPLISKEVAECVWGARKYLTSVAESTAALNERTNGISGISRNTDSYAEWENIDKGIKSQWLKYLLSQDRAKTIDNIRVQRLMGILPERGKATWETIPSKKDRSMFSCVRYQFFLDADFEIGQQCCNIMKKNPAATYHKETGRHPITAMMASESRLRTQKWLKQGCNAFEAKKPMSMPMAFWTEQDVLLYISQYHIPIASIYGDVIKENDVDGQLDFSDLELFDLGRPTLKTSGVERTGCMFCGFGCHREKPGEGRFERMRFTHPKQYEYIMKSWRKGGLGYKEVIDWINEHGNLNIRY